MQKETVINQKIMVWFYHTIRCKKSKTKRDVIQKWLYKTIPKTDQGYRAQSDEKT
jgi:hypothetical protein